MTFLRHTSNGHHNDGCMTSKESKNPATIQSNKPNLVGDNTSGATLNRQRYINNLETFDLTALDDVHKDDVYTQNIEKYIGTVKIPIGVVNVDVNGMYARGSYSVPMATTEAALVASYSRGCKMVSACGGVNTVVIEKPVLLSPEFYFGNISDANNFFQWFNCPEIFDMVKKAAETTNRHGKLKHTSATLHGNKVLTKFVYESENVSAEPGYRSTTAANVAIRELLQEAPVQPQKWWLNAVGFSHNSGPFTNSRSFYVTGEVICPKDDVEQILRTTVENLTILSESVMVSQYMQGVKDKHLNVTCANN
ncbi:uncharacterized protein [Antedon mediterranea]|uniref:uncharacterized protein n=1 Tax=Antedon mediterranea TaxID=105859 RepID=UPI003AF993F4